MSSGLKRLSEERHDAPCKRSKKTPPLERMEIDPADSTTPPEAETGNSIEPGDWVRVIKKKHRLSNVHAAMVVTVSRPDILVDEKGKKRPRRLSVAQLRKQSKVVVLRIMLCGE